MQLSGLIRTNCPPRFAGEGAAKPTVLQQLIPAGSKLEEAAPGTFTFSIIKSFGPIRLTLPGTLTVAPTGRANDQRLTAVASHIIGGKVNLTLDFTFVREGDATRWTYDGELTATGLAQRVLREREGRVGGVLRSVLFGIKLQAEQMFAQKPAAKPAATA